MANEVRLIDAAPLIADGWVLERHGISNRLIGIKSLADVPTIDPVIFRPKGRWRKCGNEKKCSVCKFIYYSNKDDFNYCPNCGAKMED